MIKNLRYITSFKKDETRKIIIWEMLHSIFISAPSAILLIIIWELFSATPNISLIWSVVGIMVLMLFVQFFIAAKSMNQTNVMVYGLANTLRIKLGNHIQKLSLGFFKKKDPGEIASVVLQDVANFEGIFSHTLANIASAVFNTAILSLILLIYDWRLALCLLAALPLIFPFLRLAGYISGKLAGKHIKSKVAVGSKFLEYVQGIRHLKSYGLTGEKNHQLIGAFDEVRKGSIKMEAVPGPLIVTVSVIFEVFFILMVALGVYFLSNNTISIPVLLTFLIMGYAFYGPLKIIMVDYLILGYMNISLKRIIGVMEHPTMETDKDETPINYDISFENVTFGYLGKVTVENLNFIVPEKSMLALVGHSGSGKTTITSLLARFWDVDKGAIKIGGIDIRNINQDKFYKLISEVFQDVYLFDDTIYNNVKIGKPDATDKEIYAALEKAQCIEFVSEFPDGVKTIVGEGGNKLSGGQKQRISIARALLKDAPIILLDEATASLDPENEIHIQQAIQELVKSKTVVVIAHKLATIKNADQIIVLNEGKIIESGKHNELLNKNGTYSNLWNIQQQSGGWKVVRG